MVILGYQQRAGQMLGSGGLNLHFSVVHIDKMFTNPGKLHKLAVSILCMHVRVHLPTCMYVPL